jgi:hypothetical protein
MNPTKTSRGTLLLIATALFCGRAMADPVTFNFTGAGIHGSQASGSFTTGTSLAPGYFANGSIYSAFSLTITGIPGSGPTSVTFDLDDLQSSWLNVDGAGTVFIAPYGSHNYGAPFQDHYDLGQPSQPFYPGSFAYETILYYDGEHGYRDTITWSAATPASSTSSVPDTGSTLIMLIGSALILGAGSLLRRFAR